MSHLKRACTALMLSLFVASAWAQEVKDTMSLESLMEVKVSTASKNEENIQNAPGVISVIEREEIRAFGYKSLTDIINRVTGTYVLNTYFTKSGISMRGDRPTHHYNNHTLILLDGRPLRETAFSGNDQSILAAFPVSSIQRIEIIRGPGSVLYGSNAYTGVINIITLSENAEEGVSFSTRYGNFNNRQMEGSFRKKLPEGQIVGSIYGRAREGDVFHGIDENDTTFAYENQLTAIGGQFAYRGDHFSANSAVFHSARNQLGAIPQVVYPAGPEGVGLAQEFEGRALSNTRLFFNAGYNDSLFNRLGFKVNLTSNLMYQTFDDVPGTSYTRSADYLLEPTFNYELTEDLNLVAGGTIMNLNGENTIGKFDPLGMAPYEEWWYSAYLQAKYQIIDEVTLIGGVQANSPDNQDVSVVPRLGAIGNITEKLGTKVLYGQAYRAPMPLETRLNAAPALVGNRNLESETVDNLDWQLFYRASDWEASINAFYFQQDNLISRTLGETPPSQTNRGQITGYGIEAEGQVKVSESLKLVGSVMAQENELEDQVGANQTDSTITNFTLMPNVMPKLGIKYSYQDIFGLGLFANGLLAMHQPATAQKKNPFQENTILLNAKGYVDLMKIFDPFADKQLRLSVYGDNLLDEPLWYPDFVRRNVNTWPGKEGINANVRLRYAF